MSYITGSCTTKYCGIFWTLDLSTQLSCATYTLFFSPWQAVRSKAFDSLHLVLTAERLADSIHHAKELVQGVSRWKGPIKALGCVQKKRLNSALILAKEQVGDNIVRLEDLAQIQAGSESYFPQAFVCNALQLFTCSALSTPYMGCFLCTG